MNKKRETKSFSRPAELSLQLPPGSFDGVVAILATKAGRLANAKSHRLGRWACPRSLGSAGSVAALSKPSRSSITYSGLRFTSA